MPHKTIDEIISDRDIYVVYMRTCKEITYRELGEQLGVTINCVRQIYHRTIRQMRQLITAKDENELWKYANRLEISPHTKTRVLNGLKKVGIDNKKDLLYISDSELNKIKGFGKQAKMILRELQQIILQDEGK